MAITAPDSDTIHDLAGLVAAVKKAEVLFTESQVATLIQVRKETLRNARYTGALGLPFIKLSPTKRGKVRYRGSDLVAWIESHTCKNTQQAESLEEGGEA